MTVNYKISLSENFLIVKLSCTKVKRPFRIDPYWNRTLHTPSLAILGFILFGLFYAISFNRHIGSPIWIILGVIMLPVCGLLASEPKEKSSKRILEFTKKKPLWKIRVSRFRNILVSSPNITDEDIELFDLFMELGLRDKEQEDWIFEKVCLLVNSSELLEEYFENPY